MDQEAIKNKLLTLFPSAIFEEGTEWPTAEMEAAGWSATAHLLRTDPDLQCDYLFCMTCIDWKTHLTLVCHFTSTIHRHTIVLKAKLDRSNPVISSISNIWRTAEFHEREIFEMFGVDFPGHPDLRLLILPDGWEGKNPLRKDFEDPVNMIRL